MGPGADGNYLNHCINRAEISPTEECTWTVQPQQPCSRGLKGVLLSSAFPLPPHTSYVGCQHLEGISDGCTGTLPLLTFYCSC